MASLPKGLSAVLAKAPTDTVILSSLRTPICRSYKGQLKDTYPEELLASVLRATLAANPTLDPAAIHDVAVGVVLSELGGSKAARMAMNHVGYPTTTSLYTVNRACSSSLQAIAAVAAQIRVGAIDSGIGAGMESMTRNYGSRAIPVDLWPALKDSPNPDARDCIMPMGLTSENVAKRYGVSRADQDAFAVESHVRAARARESGAFADEIVPVETTFQEVDKQGNKVGEAKPIVAREDDGIRASATIEGLAKLKAVFAADGASTAGNSSQVSDGAAATLLMRRSTATELGLTGSIIGKFVGAVSVGCKPDEMGIGPALAIPKVLGQFGLSNGDVDRWEINEAFASQALYSVRALGLEGAMDKINPDGGAIALGHPLGATGARMTATLLHGLKRTGGEVGVVSMCVGTGMVSSIFSFLLSSRARSATSDRLSLRTADTVLGTTADFPALRVWLAYSCGSRVTGTMVSRLSNGPHGPPKIKTNAFLQRQHGQYPKAISYSRFIPRRPNFLADGEHATLWSTCSIGLTPGHCIVASMQSDEVPLLFPMLHSSRYVRLRWVITPSHMMPSAQQVATSFHVKVFCMF